MLKNYFKIAIAVLKRRKFFTFISLFGISFTLTIIIVLAAFIDQVVSNTYPDRKRDRSLYINSMEETGGPKGHQSSSSAPVSFYFLDHYAGRLKTPAAIAISSLPNGTNAYINDKKIPISYKYTNAAWWDVLEFTFLEGRPYNKQETDNGDHVAVISEDMKKDYFGDLPSVVGKYIEADNIKYKVTGVVKSIPVTTYMLQSDVYLPYTVSKTDYKDKSYRGSYIGILLAPSKEAVPAMSDEYDQMIRKMPMESKQFDKIFSHAYPYITSYVNTGNENSSGLTLVLTVIGVFVFLVMSLPTLNLVNINITRIMERSSEIGVRKAFGASSKTLVYQFLVENIILTLAGGLIGLLLSFIVIEIFNSAHIIANLELSLNFTVLLISLVVCLVFGLLSGVYPAWRMSRMNVVSALKAS